MSPAHERPLGGLTVVDMTTLAMGPLASQTLGDYGAEVIKVEPPSGDPFRNALPTRSPGMGHAFLQLNRNKRSLCMDLKAPAARDALLRLIAGADVFISNVRSASMAGLGLDYECLRAINPGIIYCAAYGFSERGPYAGRPAADDTIQAMSGLVSLQGRATGTPQLTATVMADKAVGLMLVNAVLAALIQRMKVGQGRFIEVAMFEAMVAFVLPEHLGGESYVPREGPTGYNRIINPMRRPFATADGYLCVLPYTTPQWHRFLRLIGRDDLADDTTLADPVRRNVRLEELYGLIANAMPQRTTKAWVADLLAADILFGEMKTVEDLLQDEHLEAVSLFTEHDHATEGRIRLMRHPVEGVGDSMTGLDRLPPGLGQHSREVLLSIGLQAAEVDALVRCGSVIDGAIESRKV